LGQKNFPPKVALRYNIPLVFYGESEAEYCNPLAETETSLRHKSYFTMRSLDKIYLGGVSINQLVNEYGLRLSDIMSFLPPHEDEIRSKKIEVHYLGYYLKWTPQEAYYYAVENTGFQARPFRTDGTYSKYNSIDDKIDDLHYYTAFIKFGVGRCTHDASQEIRNNHITRDEGVALVHKFDGEYPTRYIDEVLDYIGMDRRSFNDLCDRFRSPHLWEKGNGAWQLRYQVK
ncbi:MAG: N-acetyl sugar amidotransferase, partial [Bacteroidota bacterium]